MYSVWCKNKEFDWDERQTIAVTTDFKINGTGHNKCLILFLNAVGK